MITSRKGLRGNIANAGRAILVAFVVVSLAIPYWMVVRAPVVATRGENARPIEEAAQIRRGRILDAQGAVLAKSELGSDGYVKRVYPLPFLSHVTGYASTRYGVSGIEAARNDDLSGKGQGSPAEQIVARLLHRPTTGNDVVLTIDSRIQRVAEDALGLEQGAIVVLDTRSGAVLAMTSHPNFDANQVNSSAEAWRTDPGKPLLNRATMGLYPPGSTFKTVTLAAGLETSTVSPSSTFTYTLHAPDARHHGWWHVSAEGFECQNHPSNNSPFDLTGAYIWSCNVAFGDIGLDVGAVAYRDVAHRFGLGRPIVFDLPTVASQLYVTADYFTGQERYYALASTAFGQGQLAVTPLQMALVAAAVANDGKMPAPYLVQSVQSPDGRTLELTHPQIAATVMTPENAAIIRRMMVESVDEGWANPASIKGVEVGGKTGTAETIDDSQPHSWFIGFVPGDAPRYAVAVIIERAGFGSAHAAPAAKKVMEALLAIK
jgi:penicillin-binding protein A